MWLFLLFVGIPILEIALFIQIGGFLGLWPTLAIVILTALLGTILVRAQGLAALSAIKSNIESLRDPTESLAHGAMILASGLLLLTPGFFTDAVGFALLAPPVRLALFKFLRSRIRVESFSTSQTHQPRPKTETIIDGDFTEVDDDDGGDRKPSKWARH